MLDPELRQPIDIFGDLLCRACAEKALAGFRFEGWCIARPDRKVGSGNRSWVTAGLFGLADQAFNSDSVMVDGIEWELGIGADRHPAIT